MLNLLKFDSNITNTKTPRNPHRDWFQNPGPMKLSIFNVLPKRYISDRSSWLTGFVSATLNLAEAKSSLYQPICDLLNAISSRSYSKYFLTTFYSPLIVIQYTEHYQRARNSTLFESPVLFLNHHVSLLAYASFGLNGEPDIVGVLEFEPFKNPEHSKVYSGVPLYKILSSGKCKPGSDPSDAQTISDTWRDLDTRPDMPMICSLGH